VASIASSLRAFAIAGGDRRPEVKPGRALDRSSTNLKKRTVNRAVVTYATTVFFVILSLLMFFSSRMLADGATYWELVVGQQILRDHSFPNIDQYSHTKAGALWIAKEWLSQVLFYFAYARGGWFGVSLLTATTAASAYSILFAWLCRRLKPVVALVMTVVAFSLGLGSLLARPEIFFYLLLTVCVCSLVDAVERKKAPWWLPLLVSLWANLHASFPIALVLAGLFGLEALASAAPDERFRTGAKWALVLLAALLATGATPYGYQPLLVSLKIVGAKELDYIDEWNPIPFDFSGVYGVAFIAGSLAIVAAARAGWTRVTPIGLCAALMIKHVRFFPLFAIVAAAAVATPLGRRFPRFARQPFPPSKATSRAAMALLTAASLTAASVLLFAARPFPSQRMAPSAALAVALHLPVSGPVFNDYYFGGFLIFNGIKTFIDSRSELFFNGLTQRTRTAEDGESDERFLSLLDEYHVSWALLTNPSKGAEKLRRSSQWREIFSDRTAIVFVRN
jgi:hypothetical protein